MRDRTCSYFDLLDLVVVLDGARDLSLIIDTAPFYHCCKPKDLIDFEKTFETNFLRSNWRGICLYNKRNMARVLPNDQKELLKMYHKGQFTVDEIAA